MSKAKNTRDINLLENVVKCHVLERLLPGGRYLADVIYRNEINN